VSCMKLGQLGEAYIRCTTMQVEYCIREAIYGGWTSESGAGN